MESLKIPKAGVSGSPTQTVGIKTSGSSGVPISVHFNANEESIDDLFPPFQKSSSGVTNNTAANSGGGGGDGSGNGISVVTTTQSAANTTNSATSGAGGSSGCGNGSGAGNDAAPSTQSNVSPSHQPHNSQINADEQARNFLQGNFFNRKRSGSIEGGISPTAIVSPHLIAALASGDSTSVGTWKLIKGKVSQTIEDIKLSKSGSQNSIPIILSKAGEISHEPDSDQENIILNSSLPGELPVEQAIKLMQQQQQQQLHSHKHDSESDAETEALPESGDTEHSRLRRGLAHLKFKVKSKTHTQAPISTLSATLATARNNVVLKTMKKESSPTRHHSHTIDSSADASRNLTTLAGTGTGTGTSTAKTPTLTVIGSGSTTSFSSILSSASTNTTAAATTADTTATTITTATATATATTTAAAPTKSSSMRTGFLRRRRKQNVEAAEAAVNPQALPAAQQYNLKTIKLSKDKDGDFVAISPRKDAEIESGVEMLEDMMIPQDSANLGKLKEIAINENFLIHESNEPAAKQQKHVNMELPASGSQSNESLLEYQISVDKFDSGDLKTKIPHANLFQRISLVSVKKTAKVTAMHMRQALHVIPVIVMLLLLFLTMLPIHDFLRGIFACLLSIAMIETVGKLLQTFIESYLAKNQPEHNEFKVPDFDRLGIFKLPPVEEHKNCKCYAGWMNEANSYDPDTFHISQTKPIYAKLEGTILQVATTTARIPKRVMWNEAPIDLKKMQFTSHRCFDLLDCRIELLPLGLARKRFFNRKYPIQLIIKNSANINTISNLESQMSFINNETTYSTEHLTDTPSTAEQKDILTGRSGFESTESRSRGSASNIDADFGSTILNADLQSLQKTVNPDDDLKEITVPCGDEVRLLLFTRGDREKEDWYRRFVNASQGKVHDQDLNLSSMKFVTDEDIQAAATRAAQLLTNPSLRTAEERKTMDDPITPSNSKVPSSAAVNIEFAVSKEDEQTKTNDEPTAAGLGYEELDAEKSTDCFEGLLMSSCVARNPADYVKFMALYQHRRARMKESDLWRGIDQSLFLGPSGSVVWANALLGRVLFSCLNDTVLHGKIQDFLQKKINSLRLPSFMENVVITQICLGDTPPLIHRVSQPMLDERGIWLDADITYEGFAHITVTTKLNLLRLKRPARANVPTDATVSTTTVTSAAASTTGPGSSSTIAVNPLENARDWQLIDDAPSDELLSSKSANAIYDSDAESSGGSETEMESPTTAERAETNATGVDFFAPTSSSPGNARRIFKLVDRITTSNFFQYATELSYVQRAMENMNANLTLRVDIKGLVGRGTINLPPPPSDRVWLCFRGPPRLWISGHPTVGDKSVDWSIVTNVIESKLCDEVNKFLVYPNMVDITIPFLAQPTYNTN